MVESWSIGREFALTDRTTTKTEKTAEAPKPRLKDWLEYIGARFLLGVFRIVGLKAGSAFGGWIAHSIGPRLGVTKRAARNLERAMPELGEAERQLIIRGMWDNLGRTAAEYAHLDKYSLDAADQKSDLITINGFERLEQAQAAGKGVILISGHFANWEVLPLAIGPYRDRLAEIYRAPNNPLIDQFVHRLRDAGAPPALQIPKGPQAGRPLLRHLKQGGIVALLADQKMREGLPLKFFGHTAFTAHTVLQLSLKLDVPVLPVSITREDSYKFAITVHDPLPAPQGDDDKVRIRTYTQDMNDWLEAQVRARPSQWFWLHDRWRAYNVRRQDRA